MKIKEKTYKRKNQLNSKVYKGIQKNGFQKTTNLLMKWLILSKTIIMKGIKYYLKITQRLVNMIFKINVDAIKSKKKRNIMKMVNGQKLQILTI